MSCIARPVGPRSSSTRTSPTPSRGPPTWWCGSRPPRSTGSTSCSATAGTRCPGSRYPHIAGMDVAGTVAAVGSDVTTVAVGDRVVVDPSLAGVQGDSKLAGVGDLYGELGVIGATVDGGYAELCLVPGDPRVPPCPTTCRSSTPRRFPTCWLTAGHALFDVGRLHGGRDDDDPRRRAPVCRLPPSTSPSTPAPRCSPRPAPTRSASRRSSSAPTTCSTTAPATWPAGPAASRRAPGVNMVFDHVGTALFGPSLFALGIKGRLVNCGNSSGDTATIPSLGYVFHSGISIIGSRPVPPRGVRPALADVLRRSASRSRSTASSRSPTPARPRTSSCRTTSSARSSCGRDALALTSWWLDTIAPGRARSSSSSPRFPR